MATKTLASPAGILRKLRPNLPAFTMLSLIAGIYGFVYELIFYYLNSHCTTVYWRGSHFLPWITIYAVGGLLIYALTFRLKKHPVLVVLAGGLGCGALEGLAGAALYYIGGQRAWDYNTEIWNFGNIGGFICLRSVAVFALSSLVLIYAIYPFIRFWERKMGAHRFAVMTACIAAVFLIDFLYNAIVIRLFPGLLSANAFYIQNGLQVLQYY